MTARKLRVLKALAKATKSGNTAGAQQVHKGIRAEYRGDVRGVAQTLRRAADEGLVKAFGKAGSKSYELTDAGREALA